jgi:hypothetical protein
MVAAKKTIASCTGLSPGAKAADHERAAKAGRRPQKNRMQTLALASRNTYHLKGTGLFRVSLSLRGARGVEKAELNGNVDSDNKPRCRNSLVVSEPYLKNLVFPRTNWPFGV